MGVERLIRHKGSDRYCRYANRSNDHRNRCLHWRHYFGCNYYIGLTMFNVLPMADYTIFYNKRTSIKQLPCCSTHTFFFILSGLHFGTTRFFDRLFVLCDAGTDLMVLRFVLPIHVCRKIQHNRPYGWLDLYDVQNIYYRNESTMHRKLQL